MLTLDDARTILRNESVRLTPQRLMIAEVLIGSRNHPTVEQIHEIVLSRYPSISLATVYNTVTLLARYGLIRLLHGGKDGLRIDPDTTPHAHAHCIHCGDVFSVPIARQVELDPAVLEDFQQMQLEVSVFGSCQRCALVSQPVQPEPLNVAVD